VVPLFNEAKNGGEEGQCEVHMIANAFYNTKLLALVEAHG
jgi:hypothetical protein